MTNLRPKSLDIFTRSRRYIPGGVNSPVRAFAAVGGTPVIISDAKGPYLYDVDGNQYIDLINAWGPMILGHAHPQVVEAIHQQIEKGTVYGTPTELELDMAQLICDNVPNINKLRMVSSGTEACMSAVRLARGYTGRSRVIKFEGCYHGHHDSFLVKAGSGVLTAGLPSSDGVPEAMTQLVHLAKYNNIESVRLLFEKYPNEIAAVIIEPVAGNMGCIPPMPGFLKALRKLCTDNNTVLIFDEVMSGFRLAFGGAQEYLQIDADLICLGKIIGGGLPVGAFGGKTEIMNLLAPIGPVYQAGTLSGNAISMAAGFATLSILHKHQDIYSSIANTGHQLNTEIRKIFSEKGIPGYITQVGSMLSIFFTDKEVIDLDTALTSDTRLFARFFHHMLDHGVYLPPSQFESWFLSAQIGEKEINHILEATSSF